ncbi:MAG: tyrosine-type recombinase/integrase [Oscillibacter sp.]|nr:tyrosine-type recombinase/integrase [Oscillibacter sp.]
MVPYKAILPPALGKVQTFSERQGGFVRNPNGYGTVAKLSGNRRRPFIVKNVSGWKENGQPIYSIVGYAATREEGNMMLAEYNRDPWDVDRAKITLEDLYKLWVEKKAPRFSAANRSAMKTAFNHCSKLYKLPYKSIKPYHMQETIDNCGRGYSTQSAIKALWRHLDHFALEMDVVTRCYSELLTSDPVPQTSRDRFSDEVIDRIWEHKDEPWVDTVLIFIYSGWRISELLDLESVNVDLTAGTMKGGTKTKAGKDRLVPIHSLIRPMVERRMEEGGEYLIQWNGHHCSVAQYRKIWKDLVELLQLPGTPHSCRHTFESLLDSAGANRKCIDLLMGHVSKDTGNRVYNHKTLEELRLNLELVTH